MLTSWMLSVALIGAVAALVAVTTIVAIVATLRRYHQRTRQIVAGEYLVRWDYTQGEWEQFVTLERRRSLRAFLTSDAGPGSTPPLAQPGLWRTFPERQHPVAARGCWGLLRRPPLFLTGRRDLARRRRWGKASYLSPLGILRPDGYRPLRGRFYHVTAAALLPGRPSVLCFRLRLGRIEGLLAGLGNAPAQFEIRVPVPYNHEVEAAQVAAELLRHD